MPRKFKISKTFDYDLAEKILCGIADEIDPNNIPDWVDEFREWIFWEASKDDTNYETEEELSDEDYDTDDDVAEEVVISKEGDFYKIDDVKTKDVTKTKCVRKKEKNIITII